MTEQEVERLTVLLHDAYPCSQQGCRETGEQFAALVAEVRRLKGYEEIVLKMMHERQRAALEALGEDA
jgi:hypothetical protein